MALETDMIYDGTGTIKEGTVPVPPDRPSACDDYCITLFGSYRIWGEPKRRG